MNNYRYTLNLPKTNFTMRAVLTKKEPLIYQRWKKEKLYELIRNSRKSHPIFNLHDGPPYANGKIHIGHAVNKILKDIIIKFKTLSDYDANYIPGWDCHGLPIEQNVEKNNLLYNRQTRNYIYINKFINLCRKYAMQQVCNQKKDFMRLGIFADWENYYLTMDYKNQARIIRAIGKIAQQGYLYLADKPVLWCFECISSLAEAEIEYKLTYTKSIYVLLDLNPNNNVYANLFYDLINYKIKLVICTTTPWTIPANQAVAVNSKYCYNIIQLDNINEYLLIEQTLTPKLLNLMNIKQWKVILVLTGNRLENLEYYHPFQSNKVLRIILSDHVTNQQGTGIVHIASDHGIEDFYLGKKYNLPLMKIINNYGYYRKDKVHPILQGIKLMEAESPIINWLKLKNNLMLIQQIEHSYPYCWRHHYPVIYRSTPQWFINMEHNNLRNKCLQNINTVNWIPYKSKKRIYDMLKQRPDWCISRQRLWGVPIPLIIDKKTNLIHPDIYKITKKLARIVEYEGVKAWWQIKLDELLDNNESVYYKKSTDIIDVWFDSGCSFLFVMKPNNNYDNLPIMDLYLEGNDQHRGWFMSSLIISTILRNDPPYKSVITHGFVVDEKGKKMAKSENNNVKPQQIIDNFGVDILRLWVASNNYINEMNLSSKQIHSIIDWYRRIRNTARYLLSNLFDFNPVTDIVDYNLLLSIDKWAIAQGFIVQQYIISCYDKFNFHEVIQKIINFCSITMGSFYLEIIKDRQYTMPANSLGRKSCQTSMFYLLEALVKWITPILPFTADEIWQHINNVGKKVLFTEVWSNKLKLLSYKDKDIINVNLWDKLFIIKDKIYKLIETLKNQKSISNSLELGIYLNTSNLDLIQSLKKIECELNYFFLVSKVYIYNMENIPKYWEELTYSYYFHQDVHIYIYKINTSKCARCWHYVNNVGTNKYYPLICQRCINNLNTGESRKYF